MQYNKEFVGATFDTPKKMADAIMYMSIAPSGGVESPRASTQRVGGLDAPSFA